MYVMCLDFDLAIISMDIISMEIISMVFFKQSVTYRLIIAYCMPHCLNEINGLQVPNLVFLIC